MGWIRHHGIAVTTWNSGLGSKAQAKAVEIFGTLQVSDFLGPHVNGYQSFFVAPDGSKEGWAESDDGDAKRKRFIEWMKAQSYSDGSCALDWIEYEHDSDNREARVLQFSGSASINAQG